MPRNPKSIACYVRVSTAEQNEASQVQQVEKWISDSGIDIDRVVWFIDKKSGDDLDRPQFQKLQTAIENGTVSTVVVYKLDRLSRKMHEGLAVLVEWCDKKLRVVSVTQQIDFNGTVGRMIAAVLLGVAQMEQETRRERQAAGIAVARKNGVYKGRLSGTTKAKPDRAAQLREKGLTDSEIATTLGVSRRTVQRYLTAPQ